MSNKKYVKQLLKVKEIIDKQMQVLEDVVSDLENEETQDDS